MMRVIRELGQVRHWLKKDEVVGRRDARLSRRLLRLPPPPTHVRHLEDLMLGEADLVRVVWVGFIRIYRLGTVRVLCRLSYLARLPAHSAGVGLRAKHGLDARCAGSGGVEARHGRRVVETIERCGRVHVWVGGGDGGFGTGSVAVRDGFAVAVAVWLFLVRRKGVDVCPGARLRG